MGDPLDRSFTFARAAHFDFGQQFQSVDAVYLEIDASVQALEYDFCGYIYDPQPCTHVLELWGFSAQMSNEGGSPYTIITDPNLLFSDRNNVPSGSGTARSPFNYSLHGSFDFLQDGEGDLTLFWGRIYHFPDRIIMDVIGPSGEIFGARLIVDAVPVPEPSALSLLAGSILILSLAGRKARPR